jgi:transcriptional regulator with XRE-family HTH domain
MNHRRTRGAVMLTRLDLRQEDIARRCNRSRSTVGHWGTGHTRPRDGERVILRDAYGIPLDAWVQPFETGGPRVDC